MIEEAYYQTLPKVNIMNSEIFEEEFSEKTSFWNDATKYTLVSNDQCFVEEVAYMMVTLHRTGS